MMIVRYVRTSGRRGMSVTELRQAIADVERLGVPDDVLPHVNVTLGGLVRNIEFRWSDHDDDDVPPATGSEPDPAIVRPQAR